MIKLCPKCNKEGEWVPSRCSCRDCARLYSAQYRANNRETLRGNNKRYEQRHPDKKKEAWEKQKLNPEFKEKRRAYSREYDKANRPKIYEKSRLWRQNNKEKVRIRTKKYKKQAADNGFCTSHTGTEALTYGRCEECVFKKNMRSLLNDCYRILGTKKDKHTEHILRCSLDRFKIYIESLFSPGMTWANQTEWVFDHIKPMATLGPGCTKDQISILNYYTNIQPLWRQANFYKSSWFEGKRYSRGRIVSKANQVEPDWREINNRISQEHIEKAPKKGPNL